VEQSETEREETMATTYLSFLVRLWREPSSENGTTAGWQGEVEHLEEMKPIPAGDFGADA
jgi:hypothetical protein